MSQPAAKSVGIGTLLILMPRNSTSHVVLRAAKKALVIAFGCLSSVSFQSDVNASHQIVVVVAEERVAVVVMVVVTRSSLLLNLLVDCDLNSRLVVQQKCVGTFLTLLGRA